MIWTESWGESENDFKGEADRSKYTEGEGRKKYFPCFSPCPPLLPSFQVVFMMAAAINVPLDRAFVNRLGEMQSLI